MARMNTIPKMGSHVPNPSHGCCGRRGLPKAAIAQMYADYLELKSLEKVGLLYDRSRQSIFDILSRRGLPLFSKKFKDKIEYRGRFYTPSKGGYLRDTIYRSGERGAEKQLHRVVWVDNNGPIPFGHQVGFKDGSKLNCSPENLICLPHGEMSARNATGHNQFTRTARERLALMLKGTNSSNLRRAA